MKITFDNFTTCVPCRVNYDEANWLALASVLATARDNIHPLNREQIICDVAALANTGHVSAEIRDRVRHRCTLRYITGMLILMHCLHVTGARLHHPGDDVGPPLRIQTVRSQGAKI